MVTMEGVLDKLKALNYEEAFVQKGQKPLSRWAFAFPGSNASVQFALFLDVAAWLMTEASGDPAFFRIDKFDDPNTSVNKMMLALRKLGFALDFPAAKLKAAWGESCVTVLDFLADKALEARTFLWSRPAYEEIEDAEEAEVDEDADLGDVVDDVDGTLDEEEAMFNEGKAADEAELESSAREMIENTIDPLVWKTELERVTARLKLNTAASDKEWRAHIEQTKKHEGTIKAVMPEAEGTLQTMTTHITETAEKMRTKEKCVASVRLFVCLSVLCIALPSPLMVSRELPTPLSCVCYYRCYGCTPLRPSQPLFVSLPPWKFSA